MAHALEARSPFLDHELMELAASIPAELKVRGGEKKWILREALRGVAVRTRSSIAPSRASRSRCRAGCAATCRAGRATSCSIRGTLERGYFEPAAVNRPARSPRGRRRRRREADLGAAHARALAPRVRRRAHAGPPGGGMSAEARILIVSPVRNEAAHIERVVRAVAAQELPPARWIVVDDRSDDGTLEILRRLEAEVPFLTVIEGTAGSGRPGARPARARGGAAHLQLRPGRRRRLACVYARHEARRRHRDGARLPARAHRALRGRPAARARRRRARRAAPLDGGMRRIQIPRVHVHGALKLYTRECFEAIGGVQERLGWDTIDETYARMRGFKVWSFTDLVSIHHRPLGSADGTLRGHARHGECAYIAHFTADVGRACGPSRSPPGARTGCRASPSSTATSGPRPGASSGSRTPNTVGSHTGSCAGGCSARSCHIRGAHNEHRNRRARLRRAAAGDGVRRGGHATSSASTSTPRRSPRLRGGRSHIEDIADERLRRVLGALPRSRTRFVELHEAEAILICVPTPLTRQPRARSRPAAERRARARRRGPRRGQTIVLESTTFPGTTRELPRAAARGVRAARRRGLRAGLLARARRPGPHRLHDRARRRRSSAGSPPACTERAVGDLRRASATTSCRSATPEVAELTKLLENIFRSVNIALVNEMAMLADRMGIDIWEVVDAAVDQAVRLHALRARPRHGRPLPPRRSRST